MYHFIYILFNGIALINNEILFEGFTFDQIKTKKITMSHKYIDHDNKNNSDQIAKVYDVRDLIMFNNCAKLHQTIDIRVKKDFPLVLVMYLGGSLGKLFVYITSVKYVL
jgi:hypothetical protein